MSTAAVAYAFASAALFGLSTPLAKVLVSNVDPWMLAGLFYTGSGVGLGLVRLVSGGHRQRAEAALTRADWPWLAAAILSGGVIGPILLMSGVRQTDAATASLLLTFEGVATALVAWFVFHENFDRRIAAGMACIVAGAGVLAWRGEVRLGELAGPLMILGACCAWAADNNLTRKISLADPVQIAMLKGLVAGPVAVALALGNGAHLPPAIPIVAAALVGFLGYGVSLVLFVLALRGLGTARTGAYFSTAPFIGAAAAVVVLAAPISLRLAAAGILMAVGVWLHLTERHAHEHEHRAMGHTHRHTHDEHHRHEHGPDDPAGEPHSHLHGHEGLRHVHAHVPDAHHHHSHDARRRG